MSSSRVAALTASLEPTIRVPAGVSDLAARYRSARPFPHLVLDDLFPAQTLEALVGEMPERRREHWIEHDTRGLEHKLGLRSAVALGRVGFELTALLHSAPFLYLLTEITGIRELLPDPYLQGGGFSIIPPGGFFNVHVDRNVAYETGLFRRLALIVYLNPAWKPEYGGQLELWNRDATRREVIVEPIFNRTILFEVAEGNYHGVPRPVACPPDRSRNSFLIYYHTATIDGCTDVVAHSSIFARGQGPVAPAALRERVRDWLPPVLFRALVRLKRRAA